MGEQKLRVTLDDGTVALVTVDDGQAPSFRPDLNMGQRTGATNPIGQAVESARTGLSDALLGTAGYAKRHLPLVGAGVGGSVGGDVGAGVGGAAGAGFQSLVDRGAELPGAVKDIAANVAAGYGRETAQGALAGAVEGAKGAAVEGVKQAALNRAGTLVAAGAKKVASATMGKALDLTDEFLQQFPDVRETLLKYHLPVTASGLRKARGLIGASDASLGEGIAAADTAAGGPSIKASDVATDMQWAIDKLKSSRTAPTKAIAEFQARLDDFLSSHPTMTFAEAQSLKQGEQGMAKYEVDVAGENVPRLYAKASGSGLRRAIEAGVPQAAANGINPLTGATESAGQNAITQQLIGAVQAIEASRPGLLSKHAGPLTKAVFGAALGGAAGAGNAAVRGHDIFRGGEMGAMAGTVAMSPQVLSHVAIALSNPAVLRAVAQSPRILENIIEQAMSEAPAHGGQ